MSKKIKSLLRASPIVEKSLVHTHTKHLHSLVFSTEPMIRLYYADRLHDLWKNEPFIGHLSDDVNFRDLSIAVHPHRSALTIYPVFGHVYNVPFSRRNRGYSYAVQMLEHVYESPINKSAKGLDNGFTYIGEKVIYYDGATLVYGKTKMRASDLHTIFVPRSESAAWVIVEGAADPKYTGECYANTDLTKWSSEGLYLPMTKDLADNIMLTCRDRAVDVAP